MGEEAMNVGRPTRRTRAVAILALAVAFTAKAADFPSRPVTVVVPYPAGGVVDVRVRELGPLLEKEMGQQVTIDNRPGAMGMIGADRVAKAKADGYTILAGSVSDLAIVPAYGVKLPFDVDQDLTPVTSYVHGNSILVVPTSLGVGNVTELVSRIRAGSGELNYGTAGKGSLPHFLGRLLLKAVGGEAVDVSYKGASAALPDLVSGRLQFQFDFVPTSLALVEAGKLRVLLTTAPARVPVLPNIPTAREAGLPELEIMTWAGFFLPVGAPRPVIDRWNQAIRNAVSDPDVRARWDAAGAEAVATTPEEFAAFWKADRRRWQRIAEATGIKAE
jgi:tripartite-type tricarboxylate transporter receptor subunit TctC